MTTYVPFDRDWYAIGCLEPIFVTEIVGWYDKQMYLNAGYVQVKTWASDEPVQMLPDEAYSIRDLPEPRPIKKTILRWVWTGAMHNGIPQMHSLRTTDPEHSLRDMVGPGRSGGLDLQPVVSSRRLRRRGRLSKDSGTTGSGPR